MINLDTKFCEFLEEIELPDNKIESLRHGRDAIRNKIKNDFSVKGILQPKFHMQGSYKMGTMIQTLPDIEYDIDDGIYLQHFKDKERFNWDSTKMIHDEFFNILKNHTNNVENKNTCIRVRYAKNFHIDLPIYVIQEDIAYLAHLEKGWIISDPKALYKWFLDKNMENNGNLKDIIKIIKSWKDKLNYDSEIIDLCGLAITILVGKNYLHDESITRALLLTLSEIVNSLEKNCVCYKPVDPKNEDLFVNHTYIQKNDLILELSSFIDKIEEARNSNNEKKACEILKNVFGDRFPAGSENIKNQKFIQTTAPAVLRKDGRSA